MLNKDIEELSDEKLLELYKKTKRAFSYADAEQYALKILINSFYGCFSSPYFRYFEIKMAEATTTTGQQCVKGPEKYVTNKFKDVKHIGGDTDSCFFTYNEVIKKRFPNGSTMEENRDFIKTFNKKAIVPTIKTFYEDMCKSLNLRKNTFDMDFEIIADAAILVAKKRYVMNKVHEEGYDYTKEDGVQLKITGIDIVRSNTPMIVRDKLKELVELMLTSANNDNCIDFIDVFKKQFFKMSIDRVARPTGVNGVKKYKLGEKSVPINVRAALIYNKALRDYKLKHLPPIGEGEKIKYCYVKEPNIHGSNVIGFIGEMPEELMKTFEVDYELQFEKTVIGPIKHMFDAVKWSTEQNTNLSEWF